MWESRILVEEEYVVPSWASRPWGGMEGAGRYYLLHLACIPSVSSARKQQGCLSNYGVGIDNRNA